MRTPSALLLSILASAAMFTLLFHNQYIGLNLLLFEAAIILLLYSQKRIIPDRNVLLTTAGTVLTAAMVVIHNSNLAVAANVISCILMIGTVLFPQARALSYSVSFALYHALFSQIEFFRQIGKLGNGRPALSRTLRWLRIVVIPLIVMTVFISIYQAANPMFEQLVASFTDRMDWLVEMLTSHLDIEAVLTFVFGIICCDFLLLHTTEKSMEEHALKVSDQLFRRKERNRKPTLHVGLRREWRSALLLLILLNVLLLIVNSIDIYWVWFNFEWNGDHLKQFVHEGTYLLIFSIIISVVVILYIFNGNLNFLSSNATLKKLAYAWLTQNMILAISVGIRNFHYIHHYALAHKRIGVIFFLIATVIGLATVLIKVQKTLSAHYLFRTNLMTCYIILVVMTLINWDVQIAKFNFMHADRSFVHFDYLATLSNAALPYLNQDMQTLKRIELGNKRFPSDIEYMTPEAFQRHVESRKRAFEKKMKRKNWQSWNWAEHWAMNNLK